MKYFIELNLECGGCFRNLSDELLDLNITNEIYCGHDKEYFFTINSQIDKNSLIKNIIDISEEENVCYTGKIINKITKITDNEYGILKNKLKEYKKDFDENSGLIFKKNNKKKTKTNKNRFLGVCL